jgi:hypothetical protein
MYIKCKTEESDPKILLVNVEHLASIIVDVEKLAIRAWAKEHSEPVTLGQYYTPEDCELAYNTLIEALKVRNELLDMDIN